MQIGSSPSNASVKASLTVSPSEAGFIGAVWLGYIVRAEMYFSSRAGDSINRRDICRVKETLLVNGS